MGNQIKSRKRVTDHGEVFTGNREVRRIVDLVKEEARTIECRFLEPACGNGNFLHEILKRKLETVKKRFTGNQFLYEVRAITAVSSVYGIDILEDNIKECRNRLFDLFDKHYTMLYKEECSDACRNSIKYILSKNIICGNTLDYSTDEGGHIVLSEWRFKEEHVQELLYNYADMVEKEFQIPFDSSELKHVFELC